MGPRTAAGSSATGAVVSQTVILVPGPLALAGALTTATGRQSVWSRLDAAESAVGAGARPEASGAGACATTAVGSTLARAAAEARAAAAGLPRNRQGLRTGNPACVKAVKLDGCIAVWTPHQGPSGSARGSSCCGHC